MGGGRRAVVGTLGSEGWAEVWGRGGAGVPVSSVGGTGAGRSVGVVGAVLAGSELEVSSSSKPRSRLGGTSMSIGRSSSRLAYTLCRPWPLLLGIILLLRAPRGRVVSQFVCQFVCVSTVFSLPRSSRVYIWFRKGGSGEINQRWIVLRMKAIT